MTVGCKQDAVGGSATVARNPGRAAVYVVGQRSGITPTAPETAFT